MVDVLRGNILRLLEAVPQPILERDDIDNLLDGYVDRVIDKHLQEDKKIKNICSVGDDLLGEPVIVKTDDVVVDGEKLETPNIIKKLTRKRKSKK